MLTIIVQSTRQLHDFYQETKIEFVRKEMSSQTSTVLCEDLHQFYTRIRTQTDLISWNLGACTTHNKNQDELKWVRPWWSSDIDRKETLRRTGSDRVVVTVGCLCLGSFCGFAQIQANFCSNEFCRDQNFCLYWLFCFGPIWLLTIGVNAFRLRCRVLRNCGKRNPSGLFCHE